MSETNPDGLLRIVKSRKDRLLKFDAEGADERWTWYVGYLGKYGWSACRGNGDWMDDPDESDIRAAFDAYDHVELVDRSDVPELIDL